METTSPDRVVIETNRHEIDEANGTEVTDKVLLETAQDSLIYFQDNPAICRRHVIQFIERYHRLQGKPPQQIDSIVEEVKTEIDGSVDDFFKQWLYVCFDEDGYTEDEFSRAYELLGNASLKDAVVVEAVA